MTAIGDMITPTGRLVVPANATREDWLTARRWRFEGVPYSIAAGYRIGSSEVPSILDLGEVDTPAHVYRRKVYDIRTPQNEAMTWGHLLENAIATEWCRRHRAVIDEIGLVANADKPWHQATIDRRVRECPIFKDTPDGECLLEIKNAGEQSATRWHSEIPDRFLAQMLHQLFVTGYSHAHYGILVGGNRLKSGVVHAADETKLMDYIVGAVDEFRDRYLLAGVEPEWNVVGKPIKMIELDKATHPERIGTLDLDGIGEVMEYARLSAAAGAIKKQKDTAAATLRQLADGAEFVTFSDQPAYRYGTSEKSKVDLDMLKERWPDAYKAVVSTTKVHTLYIDSAYKGGK